MKARALALVLLVLLPGCLSPRQWGTVKAHGTEVTVAALFGALAVVTGGTIGLAVGLGGMGLAAFAGEVAKPDPGHRTTVVQDQPPKADGTARPPIVHEYDEDGELESSSEGVTDARGVLQLGSRLANSAANAHAPAGFWERAWSAVLVVWWVCVFCVAMGWLLLHPKVLGRIGAAIATVWNAGAALVRRVRSGAAPRPGAKVPADPGEPPGR